MGTHPESRLRSSPCGARLAGVVAALLLVFSLGGVAEPQPASTPVSRPPDELVSLDFDNADIRVVIKHISELTGKNLLVDEKVRGRVTIITPSRIRVRDLYQVFVSILHTYGFTAIEAGEVTRILPLAEVSRSGVPTVRGPQVGGLGVSDRFVTAVLTVENAEPGPLASILRPMVSREGNLIAYGSALILTDTQNNVQRLSSIVRSLDVPPEAARVEVVHLKFAAASELAVTLERLAEETGEGVEQGRPARARLPRPPVPAQAAVSAAAVQKKIIRIIPDERINAIILLAPLSEMVRLRGFIRRLDVPAPPERKQIHVYRLENAIAEDLARVLQQQIEAKPSAPTRPPGISPPRTPTGRTVTPPPSPGSPGERTAGAPILSDVLITPDKATNTLIIRASPEDFRTLSEIIRALDVRRSQVLVEGLIAEMTLEKAQKLGVEWRVLNGGREGETRVIGGTNLPLPGGTQGLINQFATAPLAGPGGLVLGATRGTVTFGGQTFLDLRGLIQAFQTDSDINILSTPQILTMDNEEAEIIVGENRPFVTQSQTTSEGSTVQAFEFRDVGVKLRITPHISPTRFVRLKIFQEITNFTGEAQVGAVTTTKRQATTSVTVEDSQTVVIGGLIRDDLTDQESKVPLLGDIPLLGGLFKVQAKRKVKTNLLIFITPRIVISPEEHQDLTDLKKGETGRSVPETPRSTKERM